MSEQPRAAAVDGAATNCRSTTDRKIGSEIVLRLSGVKKSFGSFAAVDGVDLDVRAGEVFGFLGPNGAGKTTTLRIVTGLLQPSAGEVEVCGVDAVKRPLEAKQRIGFIGDRPYLYEKLTGAEFLRFVGGLWGMRPREISDRGGLWLERFDLLNWAGEPVESYSHGMRQRLLLCSALMHEPKLLILDEPMVGLDPRGAARLKEVMRNLADEHQIAVLISTHTLDVVEQVCDSLAIIDRGRLVTSGSLDEVRRQHDAEGVRLEQLFLQITERAAEEEAGSDDPGSSSEETATAEGDADTRDG
jgi:ABC-2 type transport system ATP-binding protein